MSVFFKIFYVRRSNIGHVSSPLPPPPPPPLPCRVRSEHELIYKQQKKQFEALEQRAPLVCVPDPDPLGMSVCLSVCLSVSLALCFSVCLLTSHVLILDPFVEYKPPDLNLKSKAGYLFQKQYVLQIKLTIPLTTKCLPVVTSGSVHTTSLRSICCTHIPHQR